jgi:hypothetical protein
MDGIKLAEVGFQASDRGGGSTGRLGAGAGRR